MSISEKRLAANRANARKSTGPRTPEGKGLSPQNALHPGVLAKAILIEGECEEGFLNLCKADDREYNPQTPTEQALVNKAVNAQWRALCVASIESAAITHEIQRQPESTAHEEDTTMLAVRALNETSARMERLSAPPTSGRLGLYGHRARAGRSCPFRALKQDRQHRHAIRDLRHLRAEKMNLNKRTHFDGATKGLTVQKPISKPIFKPLKAA